jgi:tetratricopeptide (TPR) repeat protein
LTGLHGRPADYYRQIRTPRESWRSLDDVRPQLAEFGLRCDTGDSDTVVTVLADIDYDHLELWGHYRTLLDVHVRIHGRVTHPWTNTIHLTNLANCHNRLGDYRQAIDLYSQSLTIARDLGDRQLEAVTLGNLGTCHSIGICHSSLGDYRQAINLHTQVPDIARDLGDREGEGIHLGNLGLCCERLGDYRQAIDLHTQALALDRGLGNRHSEGSETGQLRTVLPQPG